MELKVLSNESKTLLMHITDEDISIPHIIHHELLEDERILFAGVIQQHPLLNRLTMRIQTKDVEPVDVLISNILKAIEKSAEMLSEIKISLGQKSE
ncbi:MAG: hypothetical protein L6N96_05240 [Candidatus Methylarchaceae archaeon HK02M2]|nr:hypothetical protein [Candidatus Methylarchaceae archaeon HK02M2]